MGVLAESSPVLESYINLGGALSKTTLIPAEIQVLYLTTNYEHKCDYCMATHTTVAKSMDLPDHVIQSIRSGKPIDDSKLNALSVFAQAVIEKRGWVDSEAKEQFIRAGFTKGQYLRRHLGHRA